MEQFSDWYDRNRDTMQGKYKKELRLGETDSSFNEWLELEFELGIISERIEGEFE